MLKALRAGISQGKIVPVLCAAATKGIGSHALLDLIVHEFPSPVDRGEVSGTDLKAKQAGVRAPDAKAPVDRARVQDAVRSAHRQAVRVPRVLGHVAAPTATLLNPARGGQASAWAISRGCRARTQKTVEALGPGEIGVVPKLKDTQTGDTLCEEAQPFELPRITFPEPAINFAIQPKTRGDEDKISTRAGPHRRGRPDRPPSLRSRDQAAPDLRRRQHARGDDGRAHEAQVQRRRARCCPRASPTRRRSRAAPRGRASTRSRRAAAGSTATPGCGWSRWRGAAASSSPTRSSAAPCPATSSRRWRRVCGTA